ncbi:hypothetical protein, partial [Rhizobium lentis]|uniref:hypothetical protein n=1 Tax=Rhizobium lentis TaxID=1138194 RepID=UPI001C830B3C
FQALLPSVSRINQTTTFLSFSATSATEIIGNQSLPHRLSIRSCCPVISGRVHQDRHLLPALFSNKNHSKWRAGGRLTAFDNYITITKWTRGRSDIARMDMEPSSCSDDLFGCYMAP